MCEDRVTGFPTENQEMKRLERREWHLWNLAILAILGLTFGALMTPFLQWMGFGGSAVYKLELVIFVFILCLCLISAYRKIRQLRRRILDKTRSIERIALDLEGLRSLFKITASINSQMDLSALLEMIVREAVTTLKAHHSSLMLLDERRAVLKTAATYGERSEEIENACVPLGEGVAGWVAQFGKPRLIQGRLDSKEFKNFVKKNRPIASAISVPLQIDGQTLGVLNVNLLETRRQFDERDSGLLMIYANHAAVAVRNAALLQETQEKAKMKSILEGYVSPQVAEKLMNAPEDYMNVGEIRSLAILFADIRGFTRVVHKIGPKKTRAFLNEVFTQMSQIIFDNQGTLDKFIGDSVMAFFGAPLHVKSPVLRAVDAARSMVLAFEELRGKWGSRSTLVQSLSLGVGMSTGPVFIGNVGSQQRFDYTVIGQEVNLAKRLCDRAKKGQILLSESARKALPPEVPLRHVGDVRFKGLEHPQPLFEVVFETQSPSP